MLGYLTSGRIYSEMFRKLFPSSILGIYTAMAMLRNSPNWLASEFIMRIFSWGINVIIILVDSILNIDVKKYYAHSNLS